MRKNGFLAFCFAFIPGGGQMYLGMMRKGLLLALCFWGFCAFSWLLGVEFLLWFLPVVWFYSFFDTLNCRHLTIEQLRQADESSWKFLDSLIPNLSVHWAQRSASSQKYIGIGLILLGVYLIFQTFLLPVLIDLLYMLGIDPNFLYRAMRSIPSLLISIAIICFGVRLIRGSKKPEQDFVAYKGEK